MHFANKKHALVHNYLYLYQMKNIFIILAIFLGSTSIVHAQQKEDLVTETIKVEGVCNSCKSRIEKASYIGGVRHAEWDKETNLLTVTYKSSKTNKEAIAKAIADKGHTADNQKADRNAYEKLPSCCAYESNHKH